MNLLNLGTYPPKQCGIASFSQDLRDNLVNINQRCYVAAVSDPEHTYNYPEEVTYIIRQDRREDYVRTANAINKNTDIDVVIIQHEYGIYGGKDGGYLLELTRRMYKPYILVLHTVLPAPGAGQRTVLRDLCQQASAVVCMTRASARLASQIYVAESSKIYIIQHGVPAFQKKSRTRLKRQYGFEGKELVTTFGLIGPGKGIEIGIETVNRLVAKHDNLMYLIVGRTHPMLLKREGEKYREMLIDLVNQYGLQQNVAFINRFLEPDELGDYLYMTDVYLSPYPQVDQAISGTMAYAIGCGRAIVSTPYSYAREMLDRERGLLASDTTPECLAELVERVISDPDLKYNLEREAAKLGHKIKWPYIAGQYAGLAELILKSKMAV
ncbi:MAG: glycosyltransferase family 4 protein [Syntrophomonas sp.]